MHHDASAQLCVHATDEGCSRIARNRRIIDRWEREAAELLGRMNQASTAGEHEKARWGDEEVRLLRLHAAELRAALARPPLERIENDTDLSG